MSPGKTDWAGQKEHQAELRKAQNGLKKTEAEIQRLEERSGELTEQMALPEIASDIGRLMELHREKEAAEERLSELYEDWERFSEELERLG